MSETCLREEFEFLGVAPGDGLLKIRRAYQELKSLYAEDALASYTLLGPEERHARLERIETAYRRIARELTRHPAPVVPLRQPPEGNLEAMAETVSAIDPREAPGPFLRQARDLAGLSLEEIARRTKIGTRYLTAIETENFERLPAPVYLRGFVDQYARQVGLSDSRQITEIYLERCRSQGADGGFG